MGNIIWVIIIWIFIKTVSYGVWNWKNNNKLGSVGVIIVAAVEVVLPVYVLILRPY